jgi:RND family efflux transporter MFP subunit
MKTFGIVLIVALVGWAAAGRWSVLGKEGAPAIASTSRAKVVRGPLRISLEENGFLKAKENVTIKPKFKGQGTITVLIEEGKTVEVGEVLVEFDKTQLETQISDKETQLEQNVIELEAARASLEVQERDNQAAVEKAELNLQLAQLGLERYEQGDAPNEARKLELADEKARSALERAREQYEQVPELAAQGFFSRAQQEEERLLVREAEINSENAAKDLELHHAYTVRMERTKKESEVKDAQRELENARKKAEISLKEKQAALASRERQVTQTKTFLEQQRIELGHYTIKAERPGVVHYGDPEEFWMRGNVKVGSTTWQGQTLLTIPDLSEMQVLIQVHEADREKIKKDLPAVITVDSRKGESFAAKITDIAEVAASDNPWGGDSRNRSFKVEITIESAGANLRAGVTAKAEIEIETLPDALYVPIHAIVSEGGKHIAFRVEGGTVSEREVKIGKNNAHHVEILEGLAEGDEILLYDPRESGESGEGAEQVAPAATTEPSESPLPGAPAAE